MDRRSSRTKLVTTQGPFKTSHWCGLSSMVAIFLSRRYSPSKDSHVCSAHVHTQKKTPYFKFLTMLALCTCQILIALSNILHRKHIFEVHVQNSYIQRQVIFSQILGPFLTLIEPTHNYLPWCQNVTLFLISLKNHITIKCIYSRWEAKTLQARLLRAIEWIQGKVCELNKNVPDTIFGSSPLLVV